MQDDHDSAYMIVNQNQAIPWKSLPTGITLKSAVWHNMCTCYVGLVWQEELISSPSVVIAVPFTECNTREPVLSDKW